MHRSSPLPMLCAVVLLATAAPGCSHATHDGTGSSTSSTTLSRAPGDPVTAPPGAVGVSPGGVTTRVDVQANSTEDEYFQACHAAKVWMDGQPGPRNALFEQYLAMLQASASGTAGSWNVRWADLPPARQSAVIVAAQAAAAEQCG